MAGTITGVPLRPNLSTRCSANAQNGGTIHLAGTNVYSYTTGNGLTNLSGGVFDISGDGVALVNSYGTGVFANQLGATFDKSAGSGTSVVQWTFNNSGLIEATSGTLSFTGGFTQSATGSLKVNNATIVLPGSPALQGNLLGSGSILAAAVNQSNGAISPGLSPGTLAFSGSLNLDSTSVLNFELGSVSDLITVGGSLTLDGTLNVTAISGFGPGTYPLIDYTGTLIDNGLAFGTLPNGYSYSLVNDLPNTRVDLRVVPEPSTLALLSLAIGSAGLWNWRRRRIQRRHNANDRSGG